MLMFHCFISYRAHDAHAAGRLTAGLQGLGLRAWWDKDPADDDCAPRMAGDVRGTPIPGGDGAIEAELAAAIAASLLVVAITSAYTLRSVWVRKEIELARGLHKPLFFWHLVDPEIAESVSVRRGGSSPNPGVPAAEAIGALTPRYTREYLASPESVEFTQELHAQEGLDLVGHVIFPPAEVDRVCDDLRGLIELAELVHHHGDAVTAESLQRIWPEYDRLCDEAERLQSAIHERFGRRVEVGRTPVAHAFRLKRPFALSRIRHLTRLLEDEDFRQREFTS